MRQNSRSQKNACNTCAIAQINNREERGPTNPRIGRNDREPYETNGPPQASSRTPCGVDQEHPIIEAPTHELDEQKRRTRAAIFSAKAAPATETCNVTKQQQGFRTKKTQTQKTCKRGFRDSRIQELRTHGVKMPIFMNSELVSSELDIKVS